VTSVTKGSVTMTHGQMTPSAVDAVGGSRFSHIAGLLARYGLAIVIAWFGAMKFTYYESHGISQLVANSPLLSWIYHIISIRTCGALLGIAEIITAALLAVKPWAPRLSVAGGVLATVFFLGTLSFMITTPGIGETTAGGFPVLSANGEFLMKDIALLGLAIWTLSDSLQASQLRRGHRRAPGETAARTA
jgi:reactive chlorine resistance protein C